MSVLLEIFFLFFYFVHTIQEIYGVLQRHNAHMHTSGDIINQGIFFLLPCSHKYLIYIYIYILKQKMLLVGLVLVQYEGLETTNMFMIQL